MHLKLITLTLGATALLAGCEEAPPVPTAETSAAQRERDSAIAGATDGTLLTLAGRVIATGPNWFTLGVGEDIVTVEMDDWDWFNEGSALKAGDQVTVTGRVDNDLFEKKKLEASSVHVRGLGITFFASGTDEEDLVTGLVTADSMSSAEGFVSQVEGQEFTVGGITGPVRVDFSQVQPKPAIKVGDRVYAWGEIDLDPRERVEIMADGVILLSPDKSKRADSSETPPAGAPTTEDPASNAAAAQE